MEKGLWNRCQCFSTSLFTIKLKSWSPLQLSPSSFSQWTYCTAFSPPLLWVGLLFFLYKPPQDTMFHLCHSTFRIWFLINMPITDREWIFPWSSLQDFVPVQAFKAPWFFGGLTSTSFSLTSLKERPQWDLVQNLGFFSLAVAESFAAESSLLK